MYPWLLLIFQCVFHVNFDPGASRGILCVLPVTSKEIVCVKCESRSGVSVASASSRYFDLRLAGVNYIPTVIQFTHVV